MNTYQQISNAVKALADKERAVHLQRYFKTGAGQYGEGDQFLGLRVPQVRKLATEFYKQAAPETIIELLGSPYHELRLLALFMLVLQFKKAKSEEEKENIVQLYLHNIPAINNWDLVDASAPYILGAHLLHKPKTILYEMAQSGNLWKQRIAIISTYYFIKQGHFNDTLNIAKILLQHPHDLIHKATGWMLRELGNKNLEVEINFLSEHYRNMPRTMLRYAIEKFEPRLKEQFMKGMI